MHIRYEEKEYFVKVPEKPDEFTKYILNQRQADIRNTFRDKPEVLARLEQQKAELRNGLIAGKPIHQKDPAPEISDFKADKTLNAEKKAPYTTIFKSSSAAQSAVGVNAKIDAQIEKVVEKGSEALNNSSVGKAYEKAAEKIADTKIVKSVGKTTTKIAEKAAATTVGKSVSKVVAKTAGSAIGKSILKKIPLVSLGAGCYFAYDRVKNGDWKGACGEVASGALGCFPGVGTAASTAIDVGLAARDITDAVSQTKAANSELADIPNSSAPAEKKKDSALAKLIQRKQGLITDKIPSQAPHAPQNLNTTTLMAAAKQQQNVG